MDKELRAYTFEMRAGKDEQHGHFVEGRPIVYDQKTNLGDYDEVIDRDALKNTDLKDVRFLVNHNTDMIPLARSRNNNENSTMQMSVDEEGMKIRVNLDTENNTEAKNLYSAIERGDVSGMSFMFTVRTHSWEKTKDEEGKTRHLRHIVDIDKVFEVSAVTFPAYEQTSITARGLNMLDSIKSTLENELAEEKRKADEAERLEAEKRQIELEAEERERKLRLLALS